MNIQPFILLELVCVGALIFGLTRDSKSQPWGKPLAYAAFAAGLLVVVIAPDGACYTAWDGLSNPTVCD